MEKTLMIKDNMVHYVPYDSVKDFINCGWKQADLTETEIKVCLLSCSDLSNAEIAEFLELRINTVNQTRSNLRKKLNLKSSKMKEQLRDRLSR